MQIINLIDKQQLDNFVGSQKMSQFLQSFEWGEFQGRVAGKIARLGVLENNELVAAATLVKKILPMGKSYFLCPRGPIINFQFSIFNFQLNQDAKNQKQEEILNFLFSEIQKIAQEENVMFLRFEPVSAIDNSVFTIKRTLDIQPSKTLILDLTKSEEELLKQMHQKTRYNIKLAEKKGVKIVGAGIERLADFWQLMGETGERDNFRPHGIDYYKKMLETESPARTEISSGVKLYFAHYGDKVIATGIFSFFGDTATYLHGASANLDRAVMAPYLLQFEIIKQAKQAGFKYYDLFGVDENNWPGVTKFKKGFGGFALNFPGTFDLVFDPGWYSIYKMIRKVRRTF